MTDKIIIDGVDVSGCERLVSGLRYGYDAENECSPTICKNSPNCHYKQLKRKEQECEILDTQNLSLFAKAIETRKENAMLKGKLQAAEEKADKRIREYIGSKQASYEHMQRLWQATIQENDKLQKQLDKHKQALEDIKEITKYKLLRRMPIQTECIAEDAFEILQKCEVLDV